MYDCDYLRTSTYNIFMSDFLTHECGIALLRLKKPLQYYIDKYGTAFYGLNKMYLLMEKQHNRGQDGAGLANIKLDVPPGSRYISRKRSNSNKPIQDVFESVNSCFAEVKKEQPEKLKDVEWLKHNLPFTGELFMGHLRYGTFGGNSIEQCHPFLRQNNWKTRNLVVAGNFNLTNVAILCVSYLVCCLFALVAEPGEEGFFDKDSAFFSIFVSDMLQNMLANPNKPVDLLCVTVAQKYFIFVVLGLGHFVLPYAWSSVVAVFLVSLALHAIRRKRILNPVAT